MNSESPAILERMLRTNDLAWMIDLYASRDRAIPVLLDQLDALSVEFHKRFGHAVSFSPETLSAEAERNPHKIRAFLEAVGISGNQDMLLMVWRILQGLSVRDLKLTYHEKKSFQMCVTLTNGQQEPSDRDYYCSNDINDIALLRNFGIAIIDGNPMFDGFFPRRIIRSQVPVPLNGK